MPADPLLHSLKKRLELLTRTLDEAEIAEKGMDIVKEIKELHAILRAWQEKTVPEAERRLVVVWGDAQQGEGKRP
ncbi:MAG: hypothetical protein Q4F27_01275 [Desulfovibrionaceae bacterium]|nr:hypothetical protein [Desulfovibrionaceae bacterium]